MPVEAWLRSSLERACEFLFERAALEQHGLLEPDQLSGGRYKQWISKDPQILWHAFALAAWCELHHGRGRVRAARRVALVNVLNASSYLVTDAVDPASFWLGTMPAPRVDVAFTYRSALNL